jgi:peptide/nickel transport system substrate-binding protein
MGTKFRVQRLAIGLVALLSVLLMACGAAAPPTPQLTSTPVASPQATPAPTQLKSAKDRIILVTYQEPPANGAWDNCSGSIPGMVCSDLTVDPLTWIDSTSFEVVPLSGTESWQQMDPTQWRFKLRQGVKFHNGEPWNAEAAKQGIDINGKVGSPLEGFGFHGPIQGEVVDEFTVDVQCAAPCPIFPRTALWTSFQAPGWYKAASEADRQRVTVSFGPYKMLEWKPGVEIRLEAYEGYLPNQAFDSQAPLIKYVTQTWREEALVRAAMVNTGEADWAADIGFENQGQVPQFKDSGTTQMVAISLDTLWHPELKKKKVREALAYAIDCPGIMTSLYQGFRKCYGAVSAPGTVGITPENSVPYPYNPTLARQLLQEAGYDPKNEILVYTAIGRGYRDQELAEAVANFWTQIGVNTKVQILDPSKNRDLGQSGCGQYGKEAMDCANRPPPQPAFISRQALFLGGTSNEVLDYHRQAILRNSCFAVRSTVCNPALEEKINIAGATPEGPERSRLLAEIAQIIHDEVYFIPFFEFRIVYGLSKDLVWEPRYDPRTRVNTMRFTK